MSPVIKINIEVLMRYSTQNVVIECAKAKSEIHVKFLNCTSLCVPCCNINLVPVVQLSHRYM